MVAIPLLIIASTLGYSMVDPEGNLLVKSSSNGVSSLFSSSTLSSKPAKIPSTRWIFGYGVILGMGLSSALSYEFRRRRLWERARVTLYSWLQDCSSILLLEKYRKPTSTDNVDGTAMIPPKDPASNNTAAAAEPHHSCGIRREIVSPDWCYTSTMNVTILTLYSGSELVPQEASGVEFYYVIKGEGFYKKRQQDGEEMMRLLSGTCFVVDPFSVRGFKVTGRTDLVLLRASDSAYGDEQDVTRRPDASSVSNTVAMFNAGLHKVEVMVSNYGNQNHKEKKEDMTYV